MKHCRYCNKDLPLKEFTVRKASPDGLSYKCRDCGKEYSNNRYKTNSDYRQLALSNAAQWSKSNRDKRRIIVNRYYEKNIFQQQIRGRIYGKLKRLINPEEMQLKGRVAAQKRRHRVAENKSFVQYSVAKRLIEKSNGVCIYCEKKAKLTLDHFHPVSKGGCGQWWNLVACCGHCNTSKKDKDGAVWIEKKFGVEGLIRICRQMESLSSIRLP